VGRQTSAYCATTLQSVARQLARAQSADTAADHLLRIAGIVLGAAVTEVESHREEYEAQAAVMGGFLAHLT